MNATTNTKANGQQTATTKAALVAQAEQQNAQWPQYAGHWNGDEWLVMVARRDVRTKAGLAVAAGDVVLAKRGGSSIDVGLRFVTVYSWRNGNDTSVPASAMARVAHAE